MNTLNKNSFFNLRKKIYQPFGKVVTEYKLLDPDDRIVIGISGGKDSLALLLLMERLRRRAPNFSRLELFPVTVLDLSMPIEPLLPLMEFINFHTGLTLKIERQNFKSYLENHLNLTADFSPRTAADTGQGSSGQICFYCSRMRRSALFRISEKLKANKIALGHHADDLIETLLLNQFFQGKTETMAVNLVASRHQCYRIIRPLAYIWETDIINWSERLKMPLTECACPLALSNKVKLQQRARIKTLLAELAAADIPMIKNSLLASLKTVNTGWMLDKRYLTELE